MILSSFIVYGRFTALRCSMGIGPGLYTLTILTILVTLLFNNNSNINQLINHYYYPLIYCPSQPSSISLKHTITVINTTTPKNIIPDIIPSPHLFTILKFFISSSVHSLILSTNYLLLYTFLCCSLISFLCSTIQ